MNPRLIGAKLVRASRRDGFWNALRLACKVLRTDTTESSPDQFDATNGTDTAGRVFLWKLRIDSPNAKFGVQYAPSDDRVLEQAIKFIRQEPRTLTFLDLGCGKGKMLLLAGKLGFKKIVGVEFAPELVSIAEANLRKARIFNAAVLTGDAAQFCFPDEDFILYLYNPFGAEVMRRVVDNLRRSWSENIFVIYRSPYCAELFDSSGFLKRIGRVPGARRLTIIWAGAKAGPGVAGLQSAT